MSVPIFASLSDIHGRKPFFLLGATLFVLTSALCGAAGKLTFLPLDGMGQLILFRGLQGVGAGMVMGLLFTIVGDIFSPAERGRYQGLFAAVWGVASIFGPTLGGWLTDHWSWRACFWVNLPVGAVAVAAIYFEFPHMKPRGATRRLDWAGFATLIGTVVPLLLALTWATQYGWTSTRVESLLALSAVMLVAFLFVESKAAEPVIPLVLFTQSDHRDLLGLRLRARHGDVRRDHLPAAVHAGRARRVGDAVRQPADAADDGRGRRQHRRRSDGVEDRHLQAGRARRLGAASRSA